MNISRDKKQYEEAFKSLYIDFLQGKKDVKEILAENSETQTLFQQDFTLDNKSIDFLPAFFNFIECYLEIENLTEVKKYLIVGLSNLMFATKKKEDGENEGLEVEEDEESNRIKKKLRSRLDLLFARFHLINLKPKYEEAIDKLTNSIVIYSEIYGPESVGLTPHYYYLAFYFSIKPFDIEFKQEKRDIIMKNIYQKIAEIWRKFFLDEINELFESNIFSKNIVDDVDDNLNFIVGDYYIKKILSSLKTLNDIDLEIKFKIIRVLILKTIGSDLYKETLMQLSKLRENNYLTDRSFLEELEDKLKN